MWPGGVPEAVKWMTLAADQSMMRICHSILPHSRPDIVAVCVDYTPAIARLQLMYYQGKLVPRNLPKAIELMKRGVELNEYDTAHACCCLAIVALI